MSLGTTVLWDWLFGLVLTVSSFGQIFGLIPKLQNSLTFVWKLTNSFGSLVVPAPVVIIGRRKLVLLPVW